MLVIRMQRTGRKGHAQFRVVVQDSRRTPTSGKIVASLGHYNPHTKEVAISKEKASFYLEHGAQPSDRAAKLLKSEGVKLPKWVTLEGKKKGALRNPEKLRKNRPAEPEQAPEAPAEESAEAAPADVPAESPAAEEKPAEEPATETPAEEAPVETVAEPAADAEESTEEKA